MVIAHHLIFTAYGWWLPTDPRGSSSHEIRVERVAELGEHHYGRKSMQPSSTQIREFYTAAQEVLKHELLTFDESARPEIADAFAATIGERRYTCFACAVMPDHVHLLIRKHRDSAEEMMALFQTAAREQLRSRGLRCAEHPVWGGPGWKVFVNSANQMRATIRYIENNPLKVRLPAQRWGFVVAYDGWEPGLKKG